MENLHENEHVAATSPSQTQSLIYNPTSPFTTINSSAKNNPITSKYPNPYPIPLNDLPDLCSSSPSFDPSLPDEPHSSGSLTYHFEGSIPSESQHSTNYSLSAHNNNYSSAQHSLHSRNPSHSSSFLSNENSLIFPSIPTSSSKKLIKPNGRHKVNTLPPWAKSHDDDDLLFQPDPIPSASTPYASPYLPKPAGAESEYSSQATLSRPSQKQQYGHYQTEHLHAANLSLQNLPRSPLFTKPSTNSQPDSPSENQDWTITQAQINGMGASTHPRPFSSIELVHQHASKQLSAIVAGGSGSQETATAGPSSTRRSLYRAMTTPSPVFQRFRPLITVNGQKKRATGDSFNPSDEDRNIEEGKQTPTASRHRIGPHQQPPDDRWWQFTLPTKYRRKVEEYLNRGGQGIGGVVDRRTESTDNSPFAPHRVEMVEIDEDRRKVLALLKPHATPRSTSYSSIHSNDPQCDLQRYGSFSGLSPLCKGSVEDELLDLDHHPPTDFPLSAFSRKLSLTAQQQQIFEQSQNGREVQQALYESSDSSNNHVHAKPYSSSLHTAINHDPRSRSARIGSYLMHHPTAPLVCRLLNVLLTAISLGICSAIRKSEIQADASGILGASTIFVLVAAPLGLIHNLFAIYCEYFGAPIGIWSVSWKMFHTLSELVFVSLWSAALALTMNDELRSPLRCQGGRGRVASHKLLADSIGTTGELPSELATRLAPLTVSTPGHPAALSQQTLTTVVLATLEQTQRHHHHRLSLTQVTHICRLQASLVSIIFAGLALYTLVLVVSLFRIFIKVSRKY